MLRVEVYDHNSTTRDVLLGETSLPLLGGDDAFMPSTELELESDFDGGAGSVTVSVERRAEKKWLASSSAASTRTGATSRNRHARVGASDPYAGLAPPQIRSRSHTLSRTQIERRKRDKHRRAKSMGKNLRLNITSKFKELTALH